MSWSRILFGSDDIAGAIVIIIAIVGCVVALVTWLSQRSQRREGEVTAMAVLQTTVGSIKDTVVEVKDMVAEGNRLSHAHDLAITQVREQYTALEERVTKVEDRCEIHHEGSRHEGKNQGSMDMD